MSGNSRIEWTDDTWNPVTGCTKVSPGCDHCYAERITERFHGPGSFANVMLHSERLDLPLRWRKPRKVFVNSMSDLFHDDVPDEFIARVFAVMALAPQHAFQLLTKRHGRMRSLLNARTLHAQVESEAWRLKNHQWAASELPRGAKAEEATRWEFPAWPLPNVWLGVSVENQQWADIRIPALLDTPAAVRFLSCEPLLGFIDLFRSSRIDRDPGVDWVITGGESGRNARPMHPSWARQLRDECQQAGIPFLHKQNGEWVEDVAVDSDGTRHIRPLRDTRDPDRIAMHPAGMTAMTRDNPFDPWKAGHPFWTVMRRVGKKAAGRELDGRTWDQYPDLVTRSA